MRVASCKCSTFLSLVAMVAIVLCSSAAMAGYFVTIAASPSPAALGTQVTITFTATGTPSADPTVTVDGHAAQLFSKIPGYYSRYTYHYTVQSSDSDGPATIYIAASGFTPATNTSALTIDKMAPWVSALSDDGDSTTATDQLTASWTIGDNLSGVVDIQYAIGTTPGGTDAVGWTSIDATNTSGYTATGLSLSPCHTYYMSVKAKDAAGNWSDPNSTDGIAVMGEFQGFSVYPNVAKPGDLVDVTLYTPYGVTPTWGPYLYVNSQAAELMSYDGSTTYDFHWYVPENEPEGWAGIYATGGGFYDYGSSWSLFIDGTGPSGTVSINGGAQVTHSQDVTLTLSAADSGCGVAQMQFSSDGTYWTSPEQYTTTRAWRLSDNNGSKTVSVRYIDNVGNISASPITAGITLAAPVTTTIADAKTLTAGTYVCLPEDYVSAGSDVVDGAFYMQDPNGTAGIRVKTNDDTITKGDIVAVVGEFNIDTTTSEPYIDTTVADTSVTVTGGDVYIPPAIVESVNDLAAKQGMLVWAHGFVTQMGGAYALDSGIQIHTDGLISPPTLVGNGDSYDVVGVASVDASGQSCLMASEGQFTPAALPGNDSLFASLVGLPAVTAQVLYANTTFTCYYNEVANIHWINTDSTLEPVCGWGGQLLIDDTVSQGGRGTDQYWVGIGHGPYGHEMAAVEALPPHPTSWISIPFGWPPLPDRWSAYANRDDDGDDHADGWDTVDKGSYRFDTTSYHNGPYLLATRDRIQLVLDQTGMASDQCEQGIVRLFNVNNLQVTTPSAPVVFIHNTSNEKINFWVGLNDGVANADDPDTGPCRTQVTVKIYSVPLGSSQPFEIPLTMPPSGNLEYQWDTSGVPLGLYAYGVEAQHNEYTWQSEYDEGGVLHAIRSVPGGPIDMDASTCDGRYGPYLVSSVYQNGAIVQGQNNTLTVNFIYTLNCSQPAHDCIVTIYGPNKETITGYAIDKTAGTHSASASFTKLGSGTYYCVVSARDSSLNNKCHKYLPALVNGFSFNVP